MAKGPIRTKTDGRRKVRPEPVPAAKSLRAPQRPAEPVPDDEAEVTTGRDAGERALERAIGGVIREQRRQQRLTISDVAEQARISRGMLSKIENGQVSTGLDTLAKLSAALGISLARLFANYDLPTGGAQHVHQGDGMQVVRRGTKRGHTYQLLAYDKGPQKTFEPFLVLMDDASEVFPSFEHPGTEFIHILEGVIEYRHGQQTYLLQPGDSLTFRGEVPHGPEKLLQTPIRMLSIIVYGETGQT